MAPKRIRPRKHKNTYIYTYKHIYESKAFFFLPLLFSVCICRLPCWLSSKEFICQCRRPGLDPWVRKSPWRRTWQPIPLFLPGKYHGQRSLAGYSPCGHKRVRHNWATKEQLWYMYMYRYTYYINTYIYKPIHILIFFISSKSYFIRSLEIFLLCDHLELKILFSSQALFFNSFPGGQVAKESTCNAGETWVWSLGWEDPLEKGTAYLLVLENLESLNE